MVLPVSPLGVCGRDFGTGGPTELEDPFGVGVLDTEPRMRGTTRGDRSRSRERCLPPGATLSGFSTPGTGGVTLGAGVG